MALITWPAGQQVSGSAGGTTFSHNRFGPYMRNRSIPVNPNTDRQVAVRNAVNNLTIAWQNTLTEAQRGQWAAYAANVPWTNKLGQSVFLTALNMYVRSNVVRLQAAMAQVDPGPAIFNLGDTEASLGCTASEATQVATITFDDTKPWASEDGAGQAFYAGLPKNASVKFFNGPWRWCGVALGDSIAPVTSPYLPAWPFPFQDGQRLWLRSRITRADGRLSEFAQLNFLAAA